MHPKPYRELFVSPYTLELFSDPNSRTSVKKRHGFLLKCIFVDGSMGYSDVHPLLEFDDLCIDKQINLLKKDSLTCITKKSLYFASVDAHFRIQGVSAFKNFSSIPGNHVWINRQTDFESIDNNTTIKIKFGINFTDEICFLNEVKDIFKFKSIKARIDFNGSLTINKAKYVFEQLSKYKSIIDFVEDPFEVVDENTYAFLLNYNDKFNYAFDFCQFSNDKYKGIFTYQVIKPAREDFSFKDNLIFTSSMDHPLGQISALYDSCLYFESFETQLCGFLSHVLLEPNAYSKVLRTSDNILCPDLNDIGFGFSSLLENERWVKIV